jgi:hypothetical protein
MHPVVIHSTLQWLSGVGRLVPFFLLLPEVVGSSLGIFSLQSVPFAVLVILLLAQVFGWLSEVMLSEFYRAENAFILLVIVSM